LFLVFPWRRTKGTSVAVAPLECIEDVAVRLDQARGKRVARARSDQSFSSGKQSA